MESHTQFKQKSPRVCLTCIMHVEKNTDSAHFALGALFYYILYDFHSAHIPASLNIWEHTSAREGIQRGYACQSGILMFLFQDATASNYVLQVLKKKMHFLK